MIPNWKPLVLEVPVTVDTAAYAANDVVGGTLQVDVPQVSGGGYVHGVRLVDDGDKKAALRLYVYNGAPSDIKDNAAFAPTEADWLKTLGCIAIAAADYDDAGDDACVFAKGVDRKTGEPVTFDNLPNGRLYFRLVADATPQWTSADDLTLHVTLWVA